MQHQERVSPIEGQETSQAMLSFACEGPIDSTSGMPTESQRASTQGEIPAGGYTLLQAPEHPRSSAPFLVVAGEIFNELMHQGHQNQLQQELRGEQQQEAQQGQQAWGQLERRTDLQQPEAVDAARQLRQSHHQHDMQVQREPVQQAQQDLVLEQQQKESHRQQDDEQRREQQPQNEQHQMPQEQQGEIGQQEEQQQEQHAHQQEQDSLHQQHQRHEEGQQADQQAAMLQEADEEPQALQDRQQHEGKELHGQLEDQPQQQEQQQQVREKEKSRDQQEQQTQQHQIQRHQPRTGDEAVRPCGSPGSHSTLSREISLSESESSQAEHRCDAHPPAAAPQPEGSSPEAQMREQHLTGQRPAAAASVSLCPRVDHVQANLQAPTHAMVILNPSRQQQQHHEHQRQQLLRDRLTLSQLLAKTFNRNPPVTPRPSPVLLRPLQQQEPLLPVAGTLGPRPRAPSATPHAATAAPPLVPTLTQAPATFPLRGPSTWPGTFLPLPQQRVPPLNASTLATLLQTTTEQQTSPLAPSNDLSAAAAAAVTTAAVARVAAVRAAAARAAAVAEARAAAALRASVAASGGAIPAREAAVGTAATAARVAAAPKVATATAVTPRAIATAAASLPVAAPVGATRRVAGPASASAAGAAAACTARPAAAPTPKTAIARKATTVGRAAVGGKGQAAQKKAGAPAAAAAAGPQKKHKARLPSAEPAEPPAKRRKQQQQTQKHQQQLQHPQLRPLFARHMIPVLRHPVNPARSRSRSVSSSSGSSSCCSHRCSSTSSSGSSSGRSGRSSSIANSKASAALASCTKGNAAGSEPPTGRRPRGRPRKNAGVGAASTAAKAAAGRRKVAEGEGPTGGSPSRGLQRTPEPEISGAPTGKKSAAGRVQRIPAAVQRNGRSAGALPCVVAADDAVAAAGKAVALLQRLMSRAHVEARGAAGERQSRRTAETSGGMSGATSSTDSRVQAKPPIEAPAVAAAGTQRQTTWSSNSGKITRGLAPPPRPSRRHSYSSGASEGEENTAGEASSAGNVGVETVSSAAAADVTMQRQGPQAYTEWVVRMGRGSDAPQQSGQASPARHPASPTSSNIGESPQHTVSAAGFVPLAAAPAQNQQQQHQQQQQQQQQQRATTAAASFPERVRVEAAAHKESFRTFAATPAASSQLGDASDPFRAQRYAEQQQPLQHRCCVGSAWQHQPQQRHVYQPRGASVVGPGVPIQTSVPARMEWASKPWVASEEGRVTSAQPYPTRAPTAPPAGGPLLVHGTHPAAPQCSPSPDPADRELATRLPVQQARPQRGVSHVQIEEAPPPHVRPCEDSAAAAHYHAAGTTGAGAATADAPTACSRKLTAREGPPRCTETVNSGASLRHEQYQRYLQERQERARKRQLRKVKYLFALHCRLQGLLSHAAVVLEELRDACDSSLEALYALEEEADPAATAVDAESAGAVSAEEVPWEGELARYSKVAGAANCMHSSPRVQLNSSGAEGVRQAIAPGRTGSANATPTNPERFCIAPARIAPAPELMQCQQQPVQHSQLMQQQQTQEAQQQPRELLHVQGQQTSCLEQQQRPFQGLQAQPPPQHILQLRQALHRHTQQEQQHRPLQQQPQPQMASQMHQGHPLQAHMQQHRQLQRPTQEPMLGQEPGVQGQTQLRTQMPLQQSLMQGEQAVQRQHSMQQLPADPLPPQTQVQEQIALTQSGLQQQSVHQQLPLQQQAPQEQIRGQMPMQHHMQTQQQPTAEPMLTQRQVPMQQQQQLTQEHVPRPSQVPLVSMQQQQPQQLVRQQQPKEALLQSQESMRLRQRPTQEQSSQQRVPQQQPLRNTLQPPTLQWHALQVQLHQRQARREMQSSTGPQATAPDLPASSYPCTLMLRHPGSAEQTTAAETDVAAQKGLAGHWLSQIITPSTTSGGCGRSCSSYRSCAISGAPTAREEGQGIERESVSNSAASLPSGRPPHTHAGSTLSTGQSSVDPKYRLRLRPRWWCSPLGLSSGEGPQKG